MLHECIFWSSPFPSPNFLYFLSKLKLLFIVLFSGTRIPAAAMDVLEAIQNNDADQKTAA